MRSHTIDKYFPTLSLRTSPGYISKCRQRDQRIFLLSHRFFIQDSNVVAPLLGARQVVPATANYAYHCRGSLKIDLSYYDYQMISRNIHKTRSYRPFMNEKLCLLATVEDWEDISS
jgi:hypothetical protein